MIGIIGVGSVGKNLLDSFRLRLPNEEFIVIDDDIVNKNNIQYKKKYIGQKKTDSCVDQHDNVSAITEYVENNNLTSLIKKSLARCSTIFDCRDTFEDRTTFDAIKIFVNKDKLIVDFGKKLLFRYDVEGEYVSYISDQFIKSLVATFTMTWTKKKNNIEKYIKNGNAIAINQLGMIDELQSTIIIKEDITKLLVDQQKNISYVSVDVEDGLYDIMNRSFDLSEYKINDIVSIIDDETCLFPAMYMISTIKNDTMYLRIMNQTGGA